MCLYVYVLANDSVIRRLSKPNTGNVYETVRRSIPEDHIIFAAVRT